MIVEKTAQQVSGQTSAEIGYSDLPQEIGITRAAAGVHPNESLRAANLLFAAVVAHVAGPLQDQVTVPELALVALTAHDVLLDNVRAAADAYLAVLLDRVRHSQVEERKRVSRELHDRIGSGISVAQRDLELFEVYWLTEPHRALARIEEARRSLVQSIESVRRAISDLRLVEPVDGLAKAIQLFLERSADSRMARHVQVHGDEAWAPSGTIEETFLITREALRNTINHANATQVTVRIAISPSELRASVFDDGRGFEPGAGNGTGLLSMRERAALLGGTLRLRSVVGQGTLVELRVPLGLAPS